MKLKSGLVVFDADQPGNGSGLFYSHGSPHSATAHHNTNGIVSLKQQTSLIHSSHSISKINFPTLPDLCSALLPDPSQVQRLVQASRSSIGWRRRPIYFAAELSFFLSFFAHIQTGPSAVFGHDNFSAREEQVQRQTGRPQVAMPRNCHVFQFCVIFSRLLLHYIDFFPSSFCYYMQGVCIFIFSTKISNSHTTWTIHVIFPRPSIKFPDFPGQWKSCYFGTLTRSLCLQANSRISFNPKGPHMSSTVTLASVSTLMTQLNM